MKVSIAALGLGLAILLGGADAFVAPAVSGGLIDGTATSSARTNAATVLGVRACQGLPSPMGDTAPGDGTTSRRRRAAPAALSAAKANRDVGEEGQGTTSSAAAMSGIGSVGSNVLLLVAVVLVVKGLLLPENVRHLSFCPTEDPVRGRDTLPWRMMIESGRECGTIREVMTKYVTAPLAFPGTPEWGMMLNAKEDMAKDAWLQ